MCAKVAVCLSGGVVVGTILVYVAFLLISLLP
jgi:hypothetical protein